MTAAFSAGVPSTFVYFVWPLWIASLDGGRLDMFGRVEVRLSGAEPDHVAPLRAQLGGERADRQGRGRFDSLNALRNC